MDKFLRKLGTYFLCVIAVAHGNAASLVYWGNPENGLSVGISLSNEVFDIDQPVNITVIVRNDSTQTRKLPTYPTERFVQIIATDANDQRLEQKAPPEIFNVRTLPNFQPGREFSATIDVRDYVALTNPGTYFISAKRIDAEALSGTAQITAIRKGTSEKNEAPAFKPQRQTASAAHTSPVANDIGNSSITSAASQTSPSNGAVMKPGKSMPTDKRIGIGFLTALAVLLSAILWRASRRKPGT